MVIGNPVRGLAKVFRKLFLKMGSFSRDLEDRRDPGKHVSRCKDTEAGDTCFPWALNSAGDA